MPTLITMDLAKLKSKHGHLYKYKSCVKEQQAV